MMASHCDVRFTLDALGNPDVVTLSQIASRARSNGNIVFADWLSDRKNSRVIPYRLESCDYAAVRNEGPKDGQWVIENKRQTVYAKVSLSLRERITAARKLATGGRFLRRRMFARRDAASGGCLCHGSQEEWRGVMPPV